jgi:REP element-mobilizing transposase RayT
MPAPPHTTRSRGFLPHWESSTATYSITFRLADSLPQKVLDACLRERRDIFETAAYMQRPLTDLEHARLDRLLQTLDTYLDQGRGTCYLQNPQIAQLVASALQHFHTTRYHLLTWCIMPNHVHVLLSPIPPHTLASILHSWKSFTALHANRLLRRTGTFWMPEYFDHLIRNPQDLHRAHTYILNNPIKANLNNWPHVGTHLPPADTPTTDLPPNSSA